MSDAANESMYQTHPLICADCRTDAIVSIVQLSDGRERPLCCFCVDDRYRRDSEPKQRQLFETTRETVPPPRLNTLERPNTPERATMR